MTEKSKGQKTSKKTSEIQTNRRQEGYTMVVFGIFFDYLYFLSEL